MTAWPPGGGGIVSGAFGGVQRVEWMGMERWEGATRGWGGVGGGRRTYLRSVSIGGLDGGSPWTCSWSSSSVCCS